MRTLPSMHRSERLNDLAAAYDAHASEREAAGEPEWRDRIKEDFVGRLPPGGRVLEVGAGVGYTARWFADRGVDIVATDLSPANVDLIRQKGVPAEVSDMADLGFDDGSFAGVWAASCLMHVPEAEIDDVLTEVARALQPSGLFWAGTWGDTVTSEGIWEEDWYDPKRFCAIRDDDLLRSRYERHFDILAFETFRPRETIDWHYQSALMCKREEQ